MRIAVWLTYLLVLVLGLSACDEKSGSSKSGTLRLTLAADTASLHKGINSGITKAVSDEFTSFLTTDDYRIMILSGTDTTKSYDRFDRMPSEVELPEGAYTLIAAKGDDLPAEFENPYFEGRTTFTVKEGMSTPLEVTATLGNARITAAYTDDFREAYSDYTVLLSSAYTTSDLEIAKGETRPAYMQVALGGTDIAIGIRLKKITEETEKTYYVPTPLTLERRQNVRLIFKTDGEALEGIGLEVLLDDEMVEVTLTTEIPDFMWQQVTKPTLSAVGFEDGASVEVKTSVFNEDWLVGFNVPGGLKSLFVKHWIGDEEEAEAEELDLVTQVDEALEQGYHWMVGEEEDGDLSKTRAGSVSLLKTILNLKADPVDPIVHHFAFRAVDNTGKTYESDTVRLTVTVQPAGAPFIDKQALILPAEIVEGDELVDVIQMSLIAEGLIDTENTILSLTGPNGLDADYLLANDDDRRKLYDEYGIGVDKMAESRLEMYIFKPFTTYLTAPDEGGSYTYTLKLHLQDMNGNTDEVTRQIVVKAPEFNFVTNEGDAFAKRIVLRTDFLGKENKDKLTYQYWVGSDWIDIPNQSLKKDLAGNQWVDTLRNLTPETEYSLRAVYNKGKAYQRESDAVTVTTETIGMIPNGGFEEWSIAPDANGNTDEGANVDISGVGGLFQTIPYPYRCWEIWQPWNTSSEENKWNTLNVLTTSAGGLHNGLSSDVSRKWTRYVANSGTIRVNGENGGFAALVRTVGWGAGNTATVTGGLGSVKTCTPGELYLGTYSSEAEYGIPFTTRPSGFSFDYKYERKNKDIFVAEIVVLDEQGKEIAKSSLPSIQVNAEWSSGFVKLDYAGAGKQVKAASLYIRFVSGISTSTDDLMIYPPASNLSHGEYVGSQLYIDNVELIYE